VPWRFLDAGSLSVRRGSLLPASKNLHKNRREQAQQKTRLFDHLVGGYKQGLGHCEVERLCSLQIDH
jgi:hypothetical protein